MRKLLLFGSVLLGGFTAGAQCVSSLTHASAPLNNALLRQQFNNTSSYGLPFVGQQKKTTIYFGDGSTATLTPGATTYHTYASSGIYTVSLVVTSLDSSTGTLICKDSLAIKDTVLYPSCGTTFSVSGTGKTKNFTANTPLGSTGMSYSWNFGDGTTGTGATTSHTYATNGTYSVTLTASKTSPTSCSYSNNMNVVVYTNPPALVCSTLNASFTATVSSNVVTVSNTSSTVSAPYKMDAYWNWGDGSPLTSVFSPTPHTYTTIGAYTVTLQLYWRDSLYSTSCYDTAMRTIAITTIPTPPNIISGNIFYDTLPGKNYFKVWLIKYDSATSLLSAVDSQVTANVNVPYYAFSGKAAGLYRVKAAVYLGSTGGTGVVPTYHDSSAYWNTANVISHMATSSLNKNIHMRMGTLGSGPGFIGGNVSLGANKGAAAGSEGVLIMLRNPALNIVRTTTTDAAGDFSFDNIPYGAYSVYPELINYENVPVTPIAVNAAAPSVSTIYFNQDIVKRSIKPRVTLGVASQVRTGNISVSPVPATSSIVVSWTGLTGVSAQFDIVSIDGKVVGHSPVVTGTAGKIDIDVSNLSKGVYFMQGKGALAGSSAKVIIQ